MKFFLLILVGLVSQTSYANSITCTSSNVFDGNFKITFSEDEQTATLYEINKAQVISRQAYARLTLTTKTLTNTKVYEGDTSSGDPVVQSDDTYATGGELSRYALFISEKLSVVKLISRRGNWVCE